MDSFVNPSPLFKEKVTDFIVWYLACGGGGGGGKGHNFLGGGFGGGQDFLDKIWGRATFMGPHFLVFSALFPSEIDDHSFKSTFSKIKKSLLLLKECQFG